MVSVRLVPNNLLDFLLCFRSTLGHPHAVPSSRDKFRLANAFRFAINLTVRTDKIRGLFWFFSFALVRKGKWERKRWKFARDWRESLSLAIFSLKVLFWPPPSLPSPPSTLSLTFALRFILTLILKRTALFAFFPLKILKTSPVALAETFSLTYHPLSYFISPEYLKWFSY